MNMNAKRTKEKSMSRRTEFIAALILAALASFVTPASATTSQVLVAIAGSSAAWQSMGLAAFNDDTTPAHNGLCVSGAHAPCFHYTDNTKFSLNDSRPLNYGGTTNVDPGDLWIVWDSPTGTQKRNVWVFLKVDSIVGVRCWYANPKCTITVPSGYTWTTVGGKINAALWGADAVPPSDVEALFATGVTVNTAATDIRPEDALFESCRVLSNAGNGTGFPTGDGLDGLGYANNPSGTCVSYNASNTLANLVGTPIHSGVSGAAATDTANPLAFNISGHDPFTNATIVAPSVLNIGVAPIVFVVSKTAGLAGATGITDAGAQAIFSGADCRAGQISGTSGNSAIDAWLREPLSGTMTATEMSVFRRPTKTKAPTAVLGVSQEVGVGAATLAQKGCTVGGTRSRGIGTGEVIGKTTNTWPSGVAAAGGAHNDAIAYTFFSFGNVSPLSNSANFGYLKLNGVDPLGITLGANTMTNQQLPVCSAPPCAESSYWTGNSFPNLRAGNYTAWQLLRLVTSSTGKANVTKLLQASYNYVVNSTPDYIPLQATGSDPGVTIFHSHYQQRNGNNGTLGSAPNNGAGFNVTTHNPPIVASDKGGEAGGCTISTTGIVAGTKKNFIQDNSDNCVLDRK
jgi:hypothetical protein